MKSEFTETLLQKPVSGGTVQCTTCCRCCTIREGEFGWCKTRTVRNNRLYTTTYGHISSLSVNPIEKKPFYHFYPGSFALTAGSWSCNFDCPWCQNWHISKRTAGQDQIISPDEFIEDTIRHDCRGTSISFNEPTLSLEWSLDVFRGIKKHDTNLYNTFVSNGFMTTEALNLLSEAGLDALNVDIKGDNETYDTYCKAEAEHVWQTCINALTLNLHLEITTLVIPGINDSDEQIHSIALRIYNDLGADIPWHVTAYYPAYQFDALPTSVATLLHAHDIGRQAGLNYVYTGNIENTYNNTWCPDCGRLLIKRTMYSGIHSTVTRSGTCPDCGKTIPGTGWHVHGC
jgi:pyruvate formate lyase activating enzyme